jgi:hypothetical protein
MTRKIFHENLRISEKILWETQFSIYNLNYQLNVVYEKVLGKNFLKLTTILLKTAVYKVVIIMTFSPIFSIILRIKKIILFKIVLFPTFLKQVKM